MAAEVANCVFHPEQFSFLVSRGKYLKQKIFVQIYFSPLRGLAAAAAALLVEAARRVRQSILEFHYFIQNFMRHHRHQFRSGSDQIRDLIIYNICLIIIIHIYNLSVPFSNSTQEKSSLQCLFETIFEANTVRHRYEFKNSLCVEVLF